MKNITIIILLGVLLAGIVVAEIVSIESISPNLTTEEIGQLKDCGFSGKYKITDEYNQGNLTRLTLEFDNGNYWWISFMDNGSEINAQIKSATESELRNLIDKCSSITANKHNIPSEFIDLES